MYILKENAKKIQGGLDKMKKVWYNIGNNKGIYKMKSEDIKNWRKKVGLSREQVARVLDVSLQTLYRWEKGQDIPTPANRRRLLRLMKKGA